MDGISAKKVPVLDRLVDTPGKTTKAPMPPKPKPQLQQQTTPAKPTLASTHGVGQANQPKSNTTPQIIVPPKNRRTDKSQFEIELTQIVNKIMLKHFHNASEEIVTEVLNEVRARLPGQRKD